MSKITSQTSTRLVDTDGPGTIHGKQTPHPSRKNTTKAEYAKQALEYQRDYRANQDLHLNARLARYLELQESGNVKSGLEAIITELPTMQSWVGPVNPDQLEIGSAAHQEYTKARKIKQRAFHHERDRCFQAGLAKAIQALEESDTSGHLIESAASMVEVLQEGEASIRSTDNRSTGPERSAQWPASLRGLSNTRITVTKLILALKECALAEFNNATPKATVHEAPENSLNAADEVTLVHLRRNWARRQRRQRLKLAKIGAAPAIGHPPHDPLSRPMSTAIASPESIQASEPEPRPLTAEAQLPRTDASDAPSYRATRAVEGHTCSNAPTRAPLLSISDGQTPFSPPNFPSFYGQRVRQANATWPCLPQHDLQSYPPQMRFQRPAANPSPVTSTGRSSKRTHVVSNMADRSVANLDGYHSTVLGVTFDSVGGNKSEGAGSNRDTRALREDPSVRHGEEGPFDDDSLAANYSAFQYIPVHPAYELDPRSIPCHIPPHAGQLMRDQPGLSFGDGSHIPVASPPGNGSLGGRNASVHESGHQTDNIGLSLQLGSGTGGWPVAEAASLCNERTFTGYSASLPQSTGAQPLSLRDSQYAQSQLQGGAYQFQYDGTW